MSPDLADPTTPEVIRKMAGTDSVGWHADRVGRHQVDPVGAVVSLGGPRRFHLRPMSVPKMAGAPPRMSVTLRRAAHIDGDQWWHHTEHRRG